MEELTNSPGLRFSLFFPTVLNIAFKRGLKLNDKMVLKTDLRQAIVKYCKFFISSTEINHSFISQTVREPCLLGFKEDRKKHPAILLFGQR